jgi:hypothetical protein
VVLEEHNMGGLERGVVLGRSLGVMLMALMFWLVALALSAYFVGPAGIPLAIAAGAVFDRRRRSSTDGSTTKVKTVMSWLVVVACCSSIAWTLLQRSAWFEEDLHMLMLFWLVLPQLLWFGLRFFLDRSVPKDSQKNRLHTKQNKILLGACFVGALAIATDSPHRIRVALESRFLNQAEQEIIRKCASDDAPTPRFARRNILSMDLHDGRCFVRRWHLVEDVRSWRQLGIYQEPNRADEHRPIWRLRRTHPTRKRLVGMEASHLARLTSNPYQVVRYLQFVIQTNVTQLVQVI